MNDPKEIELQQSKEEGLNSNLEKSFRKGNINFDFLQPEGDSIVHFEKGELNRRTNDRQGKRGLFNRGRPARPFKRIHLVMAILFCLVQIALLVGVAFSNHFIWLLFVPIILTFFLGSLIMVTLLLVRPL
ncbi:MAG: hypothetical protein JJT78_18015 [Leptospira sp.]|nr:hypothetical protein [Leptospira sp.]